MPLPPRAPAAMIGAVTPLLEERLRRFVDLLCSDECAGRAAGSPGGARARAIIREGFAAAGLAPTEQPVPGCGGANVIAVIQKVAAK
jgi:hypothetical protein